MGRVKQEGWRWSTATAYTSSNRRTLDTAIPCVLSNRIPYESSNRKSSTEMDYKLSSMNRKKLEVNLFTSPHCYHRSRPALKGKIGQLCDFGFSPSKTLLQSQLQASWHSST